MQHTNLCLVSTFRTCVSSTHSCTCSNLSWQHSVHIDPFCNPPPPGLLLTCFRWLLVRYG